ncbi:MAG: nucleoside 2-deoxyribosyltransferase [Armatimonadetes bacterium]|nr:nucleoside 2-deoxyribosyltransferase [Armatimonadota bacterium]
MPSGLELRQFRPSPDWTRLRKALMLEGQPDRVPLVELIVNQPVKEAFLGRPIRSGADEVAFWYEAGYDYISLCPAYWVRAPEVVPKEGYRRSRVASFYGSGEAEVVWGTEGVGVITSMQEFEAYHWPTLDDVDWTVFDYCMDPRNLPEGMRVIARAGDIFTWTWQLMGMEYFCFALAENAELVEAMFQRIGSFIYSIFVEELERDRHGVIMGLWYSDDIAYTEGLFCHPDVFRRYLFPWMKKIGDLARERDLAYLYHSDGDLWQVLDDLAACGVNALQPIEPKGMDAVELKQREGHRFCLCGNIEVDRLARGTPEEIEALVRDRIEKLAPGGGYCVGSSNTVPDYVPLQNYVAMLNATFKYG